MAIVYFAICNATLDSDQTKVSTIKYMIENVNLRGMLKEILDELLKADDAFRTWEALRYNEHGVEILDFQSPRRG
ncbi:hypothetical protein JG688_00016864 [Phytophthora aleatoria]|uniref:Uncharacterized protein n=1 Tax=Phytophthora aleatoria TaxID=2496075 RepID=A0A8J5MCK8_9STRA|nr:hypothetical protein JG688_00016864 [Phytophthora aleatoria]